MNSTNVCFLDAADKSLTTIDQLDLGVGQKLPSIGAAETYPLFTSPDCTDRVYVNPGSGLELSAQCAFFKDGNKPGDTAFSGVVTISPNAAKQAEVFASKVGSASGRMTDTPMSPIREKESQTGEVSLQLNIKGNTSRATKITVLPDGETQKTVFHVPPGMSIFDVEQLNPKKSAKGNHYIMCRATVYLRPTLYQTISRTDSKCGISFQAVTILVHPTANDEPEEAPLPIFPGLPSTLVDLKGHLISDLQENGKSAEETPAKKKKRRA